MKNTYALRKWHYMLDGGDFFNNDLDDKVFGAFFKCGAHKEPMGIPYSA